MSRRPAVEVTADDAGRVTLTLGTTARGWQQPMSAEEAEQLGESLCHAARAAVGTRVQPTRAAYGSTPVKMLLRLSEEMDAALRVAAVREGVSTSEYVRRAVAAALGR